MVYPDRCIRGILNDSWLEDSSCANIQLFQFDSNKCRDDGWIPESINWMDNEEVILFTLNQKNDGQDQYQFGTGIAILFRRELDMLKRKTGFTEFFDYERSPLPKNDYHGNILLKDTIPGRMKTMIRNILAFYSEVRLRTQNTDHL